MKQNDLKKEYEKYRLQWMLDHGYTLGDLMKLLDRIYRDVKAEGSEIIPSACLDCIDYWNGFSGAELWASYAEWLTNEKEEEFNPISETVVIEKSSPILMKYYLFTNIEDGFASTGESNVVVIAENEDEAKSLFKKEFDAFYDSYLYNYLGEIGLLPDYFDKTEKSIYFIDEKDVDDFVLEDEKEDIADCLHDQFESFLRERCEKQLMTRRTLLDDLEDFDNWLRNTKQYGAVYIFDSDNKFVLKRQSDF